MFLAFGIEYIFIFMGITTDVTREIFGLRRVDFGYRFLKNTKKKKSIN
jgi:hypothetical protein